MPDGVVDYRVISADSHVIEPPDLWQDRVEARFRDRALALCTRWTAT